MDKRFEKTPVPDRIDEFQQEVLEGIETAIRSLRLKVRHGVAEIKSLGIDTFSGTEELRLSRQLALDQGCDEGGIKSPARTCRAVHEWFMKLDLLNWYPTSRGSGLHEHYFNSCD